MLRKVNVDAMLRSITALQWREWEIYSELAPFAEERADYRAAWIVQTLVNLAIDRKKHPRGFSIDEVMNELKFGDRADILSPGPTRRQTPAEQSAILRQMFNVEALEALRKKKKGT
jgi:hypothetical protein